MYLGSLRRPFAAALVAAVLLAGALVSGAAAGATAPSLYGASVISRAKGPDPGVLYRATGLRPAGRYALRLVRPKTASRERCVAYLSAPRTASGTERFIGSLPSATNCVGAGAVTQHPIARGTYQVEVCVPASTFGACRSTYSVVRKTVRVE
ncbi:MAG TPA: hypothetical protein VIJ51_10755 [Solirubrobacteraceae bacterium]